MKRNTLISFALLALSQGSCAGFASEKGRQTAQEISLNEVWKTNSGLLNPESAFFDKETKQIFVSNVAGGASDKDGNGWISTFDTKGNSLQQKWFSGLHAPKGLGKSGGVLWVADIDRVVGISVADAKKVFEFSIPEAKFLNDIATNDNGDVFVSDMFGNRIYKLTKTSGGFDNPSVYLSGEDLLKNPNGLLFDKGDLVVGQWGPGIKEDFSSAELGSLVRIQPANKSKDSVSEPKDSPLEKIIAAKIANIDGVERLDTTSFVVSDFLAGKLLRVSNTGKVTQLLQLSPGTADIGIVSEQKIILVPHMNSSTLTAYTFAK